jgi:hypothetical protein
VPIKAGRHAEEHGIILTFPLLANRTLTFLSRGELSHPA